MSMTKEQLHAIRCHTCPSRGESLFCDLHNEDLTNVDEAKSCGQYKKGQHVFAEGTRPQGLYCVHKGKVKVYKTGDDGKEQIVRLEKEGSILGYRAILSGENYSLSAEALEEAVICFIPRSTFISVLDHNSSLSFQMMRLLSLDLKQAEKRITALAQKPVRERLAESLLFIKETYGFEADGATLNVVLTREELANIVGTATETLIRLLSDFKKEGLIELEGKKIKFANAKELVRTANVLD